MPVRLHIHPCHITHDTLLSILHYNKATGEFTIYSSRCEFNTRKTHIKIDTHLYPLDRLAMFYLTGAYTTDYPPVHIDGDKHNNAANNLRPHDFTTTARYKAELRAATEKREAAKHYEQLIASTTALVKDIRKRRRTYNNTMRKLRAQLKSQQAELLRLEREHDSSDG